MRDIYGNGNPVDGAGKAFLWLVGIALAVFIFAAINPFVIVQAGHRGVVLQFGAVKPEVLSEGLNFRIPFIQAVKIMDCRIQKAETTAECASKDMQDVKSRIAVNFRVDPTKVVYLYQSIGVNYESTIIEPSIQESIKAVAAKYTAEELITKREIISPEVKKLLGEKLKAYGIIIENYNVVNFSFSEEFNRAVEAKQTAEQSALKAKRDLERIKVEAEQKVETAKAEAEALKLQKQEITPDLIKLREIEANIKAIEKWNGVLPTYTGNTIPFIQMQK